jgi:hypothetical protein
MSQFTDLLTAANAARAITGVIGTIADRNNWFKVCDEYSFEEYIDYSPLGRFGVIKTKNENDPYFEMAAQALLQKLKGVRVVNAGYVKRPGEGVFTQFGLSLCIDETVQIFPASACTARHRSWTLNIRTRPPVKLHHTCRCGL